MQRIERYVAMREVAEFRLVVEVPPVDAVPDTFLLRVAEAVERSRAAGHAIKLCLKVRRATFPSARVTEKLAQLGAEIWLELGEVEPDVARHEADLVALKGRLGELPSRLQVRAVVTASPRVAPFAFVRWLKLLPCPVADVVWPHAMDGKESGKAELEHWFGDLFRIWWLLNDPSCQLESFDAIVSAWRSGSLKREILSEEEFVVAGSGEYRLPALDAPSASEWARSTGLYVEAIDLFALEHIRIEQRAWDPNRERVSTERRRFLEQAFQLLERSGVEKGAADRTDSEDAELRQSRIRLVRARHEEESHARSRL